MYVFADRQTTRPLITDVGAFLPVKLFAGALGGNWPILFWFQWFAVNVLGEVFDSLDMWWMGYWALQYSLRDSSEISVAL